MTTNTDKPTESLDILLQIQTHCIVSKTDCAIDTRLLECDILNLGIYKLLPNTTHWQQFASTFQFIESSFEALDPKSAMKANLTFLSEAKPQAMVPALTGW